MRDPVSYEEVVFSSEKLLALQNMSGTLSGLTENPDNME